MGKPAFFLRFYKSQKMRFAVLVFIFAFAGAILSCSLLVQSNNKAYARAQAKNWDSELSDHAGIEDDLDREPDGKGDGDFCPGQHFKCGVGVQQYIDVPQPFHGKILCYDENIWHGK